MTNSLYFMIKTLDKCKIGEKGIVHEVGGEKRIRRRFFDMGVTKNTPFIVYSKAPLGDPIEITIRGYKLTLRSDEASLISVNSMEKDK